MKEIMTKATEKAIISTVGQTKRKTRRDGSETKLRTKGIEAKGCFGKQP